MAYSQRYGENPLSSAPAASFRDAPVRKRAGFGCDNRSLTVAPHFVANLLKHPLDTIARIANRAVLCLAGIQDKQGPLEVATVASAAEYLSLDDNALVEQCDVDCFRAPGPGGQKRNKTSSAVRLRHRPTGMSATANEDRSQHVNKRRAIRRLRAAIALGMREKIALDAYRPGEPLASCISATAKPTLKVGRRDARYYLVVTELLDVFHACAASVADTAERFGISTANLVKFFQNDPKLWERVNQMRQSAGLKQLR